MRVFSIEGKFQQNKWEGQSPANFKGYFVLEESGQIKGYMGERHSSKYHYSHYYYSESYIHGKYDEATNNLVYLKMFTEWQFASLLYCFPNLERYGCWTAFRPIYGFFTSGWPEGFAKATIKEDTTMSADEVLAKYNELVEDGSNLNLALMEGGVDAYMGDIL